ncbi:hypothetical protein WJX72_004963 [[Myrmecia] bisecta]|uniref:protein-serine/threonine phosphatase n=1 Tax=[Myrmecia] bisecta TaxID=41462 RepID=A0AAW1R6B4_9CHLO
MGCVQTKPSDAHSKGRDALEHLPGGLSFHLPTTGPLNTEEYKSRLLCSDGTETVYLPSSGCTVKYAYVSQRGFYPETLTKANQDAVCAYRSFNRDPEQVFLAVFDGHGVNGTLCSHFAKEKVPANLANDPRFSASPETAFHNAMVLTNAQLHQSSIDDTMSGTTAVTVLLRGSTIYVANVGDSRAVLAERQGDQLVAVPLSHDQTPFRRDECERVKKYGARVLTLDQVEGVKDPDVQCWGDEDEDSGDPPRLWAPNAMYPGTAFTRSIGDSAAESIGVFAEPEIVVRELTAANPFLVLASDGVFEFMQSQAVIDMVSKYDDPQEAALAVVVESYRLWLQNETRTDDISMVVMHISGLEDDPAQNGLPSHMQI